MAAYITLCLLLKEDEVLKDDLFFLFEGLAVLVLLVEIIQHVLDRYYEEIADVHPVATDLPVCTDLLKDISQFALELLLPWLDLPLEGAQLAPVFDDVDLVLDQLGQFLQSDTMLLSHNNYKPQNHCS